MNVPNGLTGLRGTLPSIADTMKPIRSEKVKRATRVSTRVGSRSSGSRHSLNPPVASSNDSSISPTPPAQNSSQTPTTSLDKLSQPRQSVNSPDLEHLLNVSISSANEPCCTTQPYPKQTSPNLVSTRDRSHQSLRTKFNVNNTPSSNLDPTPTEPTSASLVSKQNTHKMSSNRKKKEKRMIGVKSISEILGAKLPSKGQAIGRMFHRISERKENINLAAR